MVEAVILAGGKGERFWPLSRADRPKQLLRLFGGESLLATTYRRLRARLEPGRIWVVTGESLARAVELELPVLPAARLVTEAVGRDTAPALAVAAALGTRGGCDPVQLVAPSDHWIGDTEAFWETVERAVAVAEAGDHPLVTLGIPITRPDTGYGYIERGPARPEARAVWRVARFHEKPDERTAATYQAAGRYFWNSGIFVWRARSLLEEIERQMPALFALVRDLVSAEDPGRLLPEIFRRAPSRSIDYGILEHCSRVAVVEAGFDWSDVGTWGSWGQLAADAGENAVHGDVVAVESSGCVLYAEEGTVATLGVKDLVVVHTPGATLVVPKSRCQEVRRILQALKARAPGLGLVLAFALSALLAMPGCGRRSAPPVPPDLPYQMPSEQEAARAPAGAPEALPVPPAPAGERGVGPGNLPVPGPEMPAPAAEDRDVAATRPGFRVQLFATTDPALAQARAAELRELFEEEVYVESEGLLYKVRVGDCLSRDEASELRRRALGLGLEGAFIVDARVREP